MRRRRMRALGGLVVVAAAAALWPPAVHAASTSCANASTVVQDSDTVAIAYDASCTARTFTVLQQSATQLSLNLSNLDIATVENYPRVYEMDLSHNKLTNFSITADNDMETLYLDYNTIADLQALELPLRLSYLDLRDNSITTIGDSVPWPTAAMLQTLLLDSNSLDEIKADAFVGLTSLQYLSLVNTGISNLDTLNLPASLRILNASHNAITSDSGNLSTVPTTVQELDLSSNSITTFPSAVSSMNALVKLNMASNSITSITGILFPSTLQSLNLDGNALTAFEITASDVSTFENMSELTVSTSSLSSKCSNTHATAKTIQSITFCVVPDDDFVVAGKSSAASSSTDPSAAESSSGDGASVLGDSSSANASAGASRSSTFSAKAIGIIGGASFTVGIVLSALVLIVVRKRRKLANHEKNQSRSNYLSFILEHHNSSNGDKGKDEDLDGTQDGSLPIEENESHGSWVFGSPRDCALLEESEAVVKRKKQSPMDDLLVYEIPLDEIALKRALTNAESAAAVEAVLPFPSVMVLAEYQGFQVVLHALLRDKKSRKIRGAEKHFVEQIRMASTLEHSCLVQFVGVIFGGSSNSSSQQRMAYKWQVGAVFEYMHHGALTTMFQSERSRREGQLYFQHGSSLSSSRVANVVGSSDLFSWYPMPATHLNSGVTSQDAGEWRCKLSIALDVALALVYLHSQQIAHGNVSAAHVFVNEHGEAKLSALHIRLPSSANSSAHADRGSVRESARLTVKKLMRMTSSSLSHSDFRNSLMHGGGGQPPATSRPVAMVTPKTPAEEWNQWHTAQQSDIYDFGVLLWELDTMLSITSMHHVDVASQSQHHRLKFAQDCPNEIMDLAQRCWQPMEHRPDAVELQEELVRLLEGRLTGSSNHSRVRGNNWSRATSESSNESSFDSGRNSYLSSCSVLAMSETDV